MMEMLARFERGETDGGSGPDALEELLKGMGRLGSGDDSAGGDEVGQEEEYNDLEALVQRLGDSADTGQRISDGLADHGLTSLIFVAYRRHGPSRDTRPPASRSSREIPVTRFQSRFG